MKILQVVPFFTPLRGGSVTVPYELSKELAKCGHDVTIITTDFEFNKEYAKSIEKGGVEVIPIHCIANIGLFLFSPGMKKWLKDSIGKFDIVHMHNYRSYQNNVVYRFAKKFDVPYILQAHGSLPRIFGKKKLKKIYDYIWGDKLLNGTERVIAVSNVEIEQYQNMGLDKDKIRIVPNGIDLSEYGQIPKKGEFRRKYSIKDDEKIILYLGRIHRIKGLDLLIEAFGDLSKKYEDIKLVIAGPDDGFLSTLKKQIADFKISDKILFTGPLYRNDKLKAYVDADVYVLPSSYEIFGITVLEACVCGTPVIVTDRCGIADLVNKKAGLVCSCNSGGLQRSITALIHDSKMSDRFSKDGKRLVSENFCMPKIAKQIEKLYAECIEYSLKN